MGNLLFPLSYKISDFMNWAKNKGLLRLADICMWDLDGFWIGWSFPDLSVCLESQKYVLLPLLSGLAPFCFSQHDRWGWGHDGEYSAANGLKRLQPTLPTCFVPQIQKSVWHSFLPKVNFFVWLLLKNKSLTGDNLLKRGFVRPFCCFFCLSAMETADHLFVECEFAKNVWEMVLSSVHLSLRTQTYVVALYLSWHDGRPSKKRVPVLHMFWHSILKFTLWYIQISRNSCVFNNQRPIFQIAASKSLVLILELICCPVSSLAYSLRLEVSPTMRLLKPILAPSQRFRGSQEEFFSLWWSSPSTVIFFDGASKGNPGVSGAGGLVLSPDRLSYFRFCWGLGIMSNNQAECYNLLMASQLAKEKGFMSVQIYGDSEILIKALNSSDSPSNFALNTILQRIRRNSKYFAKFESFHILRELNNSTDVLANKACLLPQGFLSINGEPSHYHSIP